MKSGGQELVTALKQYTAVITEEYLKKFDDPYHSYDGTLCIHQASFSLDQPAAIYEAVRDASMAPSQQETSISSPPAAIEKRKPADDVTDADANVEKQKMQKPEKKKQKQR